VDACRRHLAFRAVEIGAVDVLQNTITNIVTITLGVTAVNNPTAATSIGLNEETDAHLKARRARSFQLPASGPAEAVLAALLEVDGVTDAYVAENTTAAPVDGIAAHSIWAIVENGADADVAEAIYLKKSAGCGMTGGETVTVARPNGQSIDILFDRPVEDDLYIEFTLQGKVSGLTFDEDYIKEQLVATLAYTLGQQATAQDVISALIAIEPQALFTLVGVSDDGMTYAEILPTTTVQHKWVLDVANVTINAPA